MTTLHEAAKALVQRIDRGRKEYQEAWPDDDRELDALRAALASPSPEAPECDECLGSRFSMNTDRVCLKCAGSGKTPLTTTDVLTGIEALLAEPKTGEAGRGAALNLARAGLALAAPPARDERAEADAADIALTEAGADLAATIAFAAAVQCVADYKDEIAQRHLYPGRTEQLTALHEAMERLRALAEFAAAPESVEAPPAPQHNDAAKER